MRHAESQHNAQGILAGITDTPCTEAGILAARTLSETFEENFDAYYVSPLTRTRQTAASVIPNAKFTVDERLIERCFGVWENVALDKIGEKTFFDVVINDAPLEGCETNIAVGERLSNFFEYLKEKYNNNARIFAVTHGGLMIVLQQKFAQNQEVPKNLGTITIEI